MEIYTRLFGLNGFFVESGLNSAANPKELCKVEAKIQSSYKEAVSGEEFGLSFAKGSSIGFESVHYEYTQNYIWNEHQKQ